MNRPLAYFITFHTHGSWLHGRAAGSVDKDNNQYGAPVLVDDERREDRARSVMAAPAVVLSEKAREIIRGTIVEVSDHRQWRLHALHVRVNHVHAVVAAPCLPERVMNDWKAWCTRRLREGGLFSDDQPVWSRHGSTLYLWSEPSVNEKIEYTLHKQGEPMAVFDERRLESGRVRRGGGSAMTPRHPLAYASRLRKNNHEQRPPLRRQG